MEHLSFSNVDAGVAVGFEAEVSASVRAQVQGQND